ncbi:hypothetical protein [Paenibacillus sp. DMB5]|uniref:hypothetical protein n=1 Tax=Paenibacillus sp. DMB5 TaxID=1780103 RepID=UPI00076DB531|nr:hypothetical protein [Paenibacillus sp. DMB5]KUP22431.1 hypothetical protein AWJ19_27845 [Paenibacillus sp. DMB5]
MFNNLKSSEIREMCRSTIETLEMWLRRLIDQQLSERFGGNYLQYQDELGNFILKKEIREGIRSRRIKEPKRYARDVDAILLDDAINIVLHPKLYSELFSTCFKHAFPMGPEMGRFIFDKISKPRNYLSHANHISIRQAEQIICYAHDIIDSIKTYYSIIGVEKLYNVPSIIQFSDSLGNIKHEAEINSNRNDVRVHFVLNCKENASLRPGDVLIVEIEIDPTFTDEEYDIQWFVQESARYIDDNKSRFEVKILNSHVGERFVVECTITSKKSWHRYGRSDDNLMLLYRVLPPVE